MMADEKESIMDYCYIIDLKEIIEKNWSEFAKIFPSRRTILQYLMEINEVRNPAMHGRGIPIHKTYLCLGMCGELLEHVNKWYDGYKHAVKEYFCDLVFSPISNDISKDSNELNANQWLAIMEGICRQKDKNFEVPESYDNERLLQLPEGRVKVLLNKSKQQFNGQDYYRYVIYLRTPSKKALNRIFADGKHPCRSMYWILKNDLDISRICSRIEETSGKRPTSSSYVGSGENKIITSAHYRILPYPEDIQINIERSNRDRTGAKVGLICEGMANQGFFQPHNTFSSYFELLDVLYDKITLTTFRQKVKHAITPIGK